MGSVVLQGAANAQKVSNITSQAGGDPETGSLAPNFNRLHSNYKYTCRLTTDRLRKIE